MLVIFAWRGNFFWHPLCLQGLVFVWKTYTWFKRKWLNQFFISSTMKKHVHMWIKKCQIILIMWNVLENISLQIQKKHLFWLVWWNASFFICRPTDRDNFQGALSPIWTNQLVRWFKLWEDLMTSWMGLKQPHLKKTQKPHLVAQLHW